MRQHQCHRHVASRLSVANGRASNLVPSARRIATSCLSNRVSVMSIANGCKTTQRHRRVATATKRSEMRQRSCRIDLNVNHIPNNFAFSNTLEVSVGSTKNVCCFEWRICYYFPIRWIFYLTVSISTKCVFK